LGMCYVRQGLRDPNDKTPVVGLHRPAFGT
jgi:hypothetical protein